MFNLLPQKIRKEIIKEYRFRLSILIILFIIIIQASFLIFLFPSWLTSYYKQKDFSIRVDRVDKSLLSLDISSTTEYINSLNSTLSVLDESLKYPEFIPVLDEILSKRTSGIKISSLNYSVDSKNTATLGISGVSEKRETLVSFTNELKKIEFLKKVDLPISNLAKDRNINFSISINIEK